MSDDTKNTADNPENDAREEGEQPAEQEQETQLAAAMVHEGTSVFKTDQAGNDGQQESGASLWLITFTDVMALMLTFFVLLYSMSTPDVESWSQMTSSMEVNMSKFYSAEWQGGAQDTIAIQKVDNSRALSLDYLEALVTEIVAENNHLKTAVINQQQDRLVISLPTSLLFRGGSSEITPRGERALFALAGLLQRIRNRMEIIGHSDPRPLPESSPYDSNWDLSLNRALKVSGVLQEVGYNRSLVVRGLASGRYEDLPADMPREERLSIARRVDLVIMKDDGRTRGFLQLGTSG